MTKLEEMLDAFCKKEYGRNKNNNYNSKNFELFAVDSGGYCIDDEVTLSVKDGQFSINFVTKRRNNASETDEIKSFKLKLIEDESPAS